jgi:hypothetical protein
MYDMKVSVSDIPITNPQKGKRVIDIDSRRNLDNILLTIQKEVAELTPVGATGDLRSSLRTNVRKKGANIIGEVFFGKKYALPVNDGRKASPVSIQGQRGLSRWIEKSRKGRAYFSGLKSAYPKVTLKQATFLLSRSMKKKARKGQKFFEEGIKNASSKINKIISNLGNKLVKDMVK